MSDAGEEADTEEQAGATRLAIWSIAAHRGFADALVAGLIPRYADGERGLSRLTLLLPGNRVIRTVTEAFVRALPEAGGLLLPRMVSVGDLDLDETLGPLLDPLGGDIPPAADPLRRWLRLAEWLKLVEESEGSPDGSGPAGGAARLRRAEAMARTIDRLLAEDIAPDALLGEDIIGLIGEQAAHWQDATRQFLKVWTLWTAECTERGEIDPPSRRNRLFARAADAWHPERPVVAAGVTNASPQLARLLKAIAARPGGGVILPDLDLSLDDGVWGELGQAGMSAEPGGAPFGRDDAAVHPQYHLKLLLHRMGVTRDEVRPWHRAGLGAAPPERSRAISSLFLPPRASASWVALPENRRRLAGVRLMESAHPGEEAQAIAILIREALEVAEKRVALITPDRALAGRVVDHLARWNILADDSAGVPLSQTAVGRVLLLLAEVLAEDVPPVPLVALLSHPLVRAGDQRAAWLEQVRRFDLRLRGPRPAPGLPSLRERADADWWDEVEALLAPLVRWSAEDAPLADLLGCIAGVGEALCGEGLWALADGRAAAALIEDVREAAAEVGTRLAPRDLPALLRDRMDAAPVRPAWGRHPRVSIYGLIEARMSRADLTICGGLVEGVWPGSPAPDPLLPPAVLRQLGVPGADFRIGLAAHDLAGALGAPEVVLSWARRDAGGPVIPSRFVLRVQAMLGDRLAREHIEKRAVELARTIDLGREEKPHPRPQPRPGAAQRNVPLSATGLDRLRSDPYQFYASAILRLPRRDPLDAEPSAALRGQAVHEVLDRWHKEHGDAARLRAIAGEELDKLSAHPLMRALWRPRLMAALDWIGAEILRQRSEGRVVLDTEAQGEMRVAGVLVHGRADRIDRLPDGSLAICDYKTGYVPKPRMVEEGFSLQLGTLGLIAAAGGFPDIAGEPSRFEYWSLARDPKREVSGPDGGFGYVTEPVRDPGSRTRSGPMREEFLDRTAAFLGDAIARWIRGEEAFTARLNPDIGGFNDYDQLMRLDEWQWRREEGA